MKLVVTIALTLIIALPAPLTATAAPALPGEDCIKLPAKQTWLPSEVWAWGEVCQGRIANFQKRYRKKLDPKLSKGWDEKRKLSETFLQTILLREPYRSAIPHRGVRIVGAWFPETIDLIAAVVDHEFFFNASRFEKIVRLRGGSFSGLLSMDGSTFESMVDMEVLKIGSHLLMRNAKFRGKVNLLSATVDGQITVSSSSFEDEVRMQALKVGSHLFMRAASFKKSPDLTFMTIKGNLDASGATLAGLDLTGARITGDLRLGSSKHETTLWEAGARMILRNTQVGAIQDRWDHKAWKQDKKIIAWPKSLQLDGFRYTSLGGYAGGGDSDMLGRDVEWYVAWLRLDKSFTPQPYRQLAGVFRQAGRKDAANTILYAGREREREEALVSKRSGYYLVLSVLNWTIGYGLGHRNFQALFWVVFFVYLGAFVLGISGQGRKHNISFAYSLDLLLPIVKLRNDHYDKVDLNGWARYYFFVHQLLGYVLASFLIAGLSGLTQL